MTHPDPIDEAVKEIRKLLILQRLTELTHED